MRPVRHLPLAPQFHEVPSKLESPFVVGSQPEMRAEDESESEKLLQVGDIAKASGKTVRAIHHYEEVGLLKPHARSKGRYRLYDQTALTRVRWISKLHDLGLSLSQIQEMLRAWETAPSAPDAMAHIRDVYAHKLEETRAQIARLSALENELSASIDYLDTCGTTCAPTEIIRACIACNHHDKTQPEPDLVAGIHGGNGLRLAACSPSDEQQTSSSR